VEFQNQNNIKISWAVFTVVGMKKETMTQIERYEGKIYLLIPDSGIFDE
jgi:hypothetical protein